MDTLEILKNPPGFPLREGIPESLSRIFCSLSYLNRIYHPENDFIINLNGVYEWLRLINSLNFKSTINFKQKCSKVLTENKEYILKRSYNKNIYFLSLKGFKKFCVAIGVNEVIDYLLFCEKKILEKFISDDNNVSFENKGEKKDSKISQKEREVIEMFHNKPVIFSGKVDDFIYFGYSNLFCTEDILSVKSDHPNFELKDAVFTEICEDDYYKIKGFLQNLILKREISGDFQKDLYKIQYPIKDIIDKVKIKTTGEDHIDKNNKKLRSLKRFMEFFYFKYKERNVEWFYTKSLYKTYLEFCQKYKMKNFSYHHFNRNLNKFASISKKRKYVKKGEPGYNKNKKTVLFGHLINFDEPLLREIVNMC